MITLSSKEFFCLDNVPADDVLSEICMLKRKKRSFTNPKIFKLSLLSAD